jgi:hypothetical protein
MIELLLSRIRELWKQHKEVDKGIQSIFTLALGTVKVGSKTSDGPFVVIDTTGGLEIGLNCSIFTGTHIYSHDSVDWAISGGSLPLVQVDTLNKGFSLHLSTYATVSRD